MERQQHRHTPKVVKSRRRQQRSLESTPQPAPEFHVEHAKLSQIRRRTAQIERRAIAALSGVHAEIRVAVSLRELNPEPPIVEGFADAVLHDPVVCRLVADFERRLVVAQLDAEQSLECAIAEADSVLRTLPAHEQRVKDCKLTSVRSGSFKSTIGAP